MRVGGGGGGAGELEIGGPPDVGGLVPAPREDEEVRAGRIAPHWVEADGVDGAPVTRVLEQTPARLHTPDSSSLI